MKTSPYQPSANLMTLPDCQLMDRLDKIKTDQNESQISSLQDLLQIEDGQFPFRESDEKAIRTAVKIDFYVNLEYFMNYLRFSIGAACGITAATLILLKKSKDSPLINALGAATSGSLGIFVTVVRGWNLASASKNRHHLISELFERHKKDAYTLCQLYLDAENTELAERLSEKMQGKIKYVIDRDLVKKPFHGLTKENMQKIVSPLQEITGYISEKRLPSSMELRLPIDMKAWEMSSVKMF